MFPVLRYLCHHVIGRFIIFSFLLAPWHHWPCQREALPLHKRVGQHYYYYYYYLGVEMKLLHDAVSRCFFSLLSLGVSLQKTSQISNEEQTCTLLVSVCGIVSNATYNIETHNTGRWITPNKDSRLTFGLTHLKYPFLTVNIWTALSFTKINNAWQYSDQL